MKKEFFGRFRGRGLALRPGPDFDGIAAGSNGGVAEDELHGPSDHERRGQEQPRAGRVSRERRLVKRCEPLPLHQAEALELATLDQILDSETGIAGLRALPDRDRAFVHMLVAKTLRRLGSLRALLVSLLERGLPKEAPLVGKRLVGVGNLGQQNVVVLEADDVQPITD